MVGRLKGALRGLSADGTLGGFCCVTLLRTSEDATSSVRKKPSYSFPHDAQTLLLSGSVSPQIGHSIQQYLSAMGTVDLILYLQTPLRTTFSSYRVELFRVERPAL
jgi:hypothetical protein